MQRLLRKKYCWEEEEEPYLLYLCMCVVRSLADLFCTPVPYLPLLFQGVSPPIFLRIGIFDTD